MHAVDVWISAEPLGVVPELLTHVLCAFADTDVNTGEVILIDDNGTPVGVGPRTFVVVHTDTPVLHDTVVGRNPQAGRSHFEPGGRQADSPTRFQFYGIKLKNRHLKIILSIGGGKNSHNGHFAFVTTQSKRAAFTKSISTIVEDYGLDGV